MLGGATFVATSLPYNLWKERAATLFSYYTGIGKQRDEQLHVEPITELEISGCKVTLTKAVVLPGEIDVTDAIQNSNILRGTKLSLQSVISHICTRAGQQPIPGSSPPSLYVQYRVNKLPYRCIYNGDCFEFPPYRGQALDEIDEENENYVTKATMFVKGTEVTVTDLFREWSGPKGNFYVDYAHVSVPLRAVIRDTMASEDAVEMIIMKDLDKNDVYMVPGVTEQVSFDAAVI